MKVFNVFIGFFCFLMLIPFSGTAQIKKIKKKEFVKKYKEFLEKDSKLESFSYYQSLERKGNEFIHKTFNPDKRILTHYKTYSDSKMENLNGRYQEWYDNGHLWEEGRYKNNEKDGKWSTYSYDSGKVKEYGHFKNGKEEGTWFSLDDQGRITSEYNYLSGELEGDYLRYDSLGNVVQKIIYQAGDEIENEIFDSTYTNSELKDVEVLPFLKTCADLAGDERKQCSDNKYLHFIYGNINYPQSARRRDIEGKAIIRFVITKEGKVDEVTPLRGVCQAIEKECIRIINSSPEWSPETVNDQPVNVYFNMPVNFRLE